MNTKKPQSFFLVGHGVARGITQDEAAAPDLNLDHDLILVAAAFDADALLVAAQFDAGQAEYTNITMDDGSTISAVIAPPARQFQPTPRPSSCPWGKIDDAKQIAPGIWSVGTSSHGGYILSGERLQAMPQHLRINHYAGNAHAFEEDCEWSLVVMAWPDEFTEAERYNAGRVISATCRFSFPGFDADPWKTVLEKHPPLKLAELSRQSRIDLVRYRNWNDVLTEEQATAYVDAGEDLKEERP